MSFRTASLLLLVTPIFAMADGMSPYADASSREIKALSAQEAEGLLEGKGMGLAMAAELNGYPGPKHVLELAVKLDLTKSQHEATERLFTAMQEEARALGVRLLEAERELDRMFASGEAEAAGIRAQLQHIGRLRADLRFTHLSAHLSQLDILDDEQVNRYKRLRGYADQEDHHDHGGH